MKDYINIELDINQRFSIKEYMEQSLGYSSRQAKKLIKEKKVAINGKTAYWDNVIKNGDVLIINEREETASSIIPQELPLDIIYEDDWFMAVNKPPYMVMHPTKNTIDGTLANAVANYYKKTSQNISLRFLNRLDMNTSGIVVLPKSSKAHSDLSIQMEAGTIKKKYLAVVEGIVNTQEGLIEQPIGVDSQNHIKRAVAKDGQYAATAYKVIKPLGASTIVELELLTGRTHQIRVHLSYIGYPIIGDELYGHKSEIIERQALHAKELAFKHPASGEAFVLCADIPKDISNLIKQLS